MMPGSYHQMSSLTNCQLHLLQPIFAPLAQRLRFCHISEKKTVLLFFCCFSKGLNTDDVNNNCCHDNFDQFFFNFDNNDDKKY